MNNQFKKGVIEICILKYIQQDDRYGYEIVKEFENLLEIKESTIYPILKRFKNDKMVDTYLVESSNGPARKYYKITEEGKEYLLLKISAWTEFSKRIDEYLNS